MAIKPIYTTEALATGGGRNGHTRTADGVVDFELASPKEMGGSGEGANPEQLFAAGYAACFLGALQKVGGEAELDVTDATVGAKVSIGSDPEGGVALAVDLEVVVPNLERAEAEKLAEDTHGFCPYSKATRGNIDVNITVVDD